MKPEKIWRDFSALSPERQQQVADFISFLRTRQTSAPRKVLKRAKLANEPFVGMWRDREDLTDSTGWVRRVRQREWTSDRA
jgi:hypothetical protein